MATSASGRDARTPSCSSKRTTRSASVSLRKYTRSWVSANRLKRSPTRSPSNPPGRCSRRGLLCRPLSTSASQPASISGQRAERLLGKVRSFRESLYICAIGALMPEITDVRERRGKARVFVDGEFWAELDSGVAIESGPREGAAFSSGELDGVRVAGERPLAMGRALNLLGYRARSRAEMRERLRGYGYAEETIGRVV